MRAGVNGSPQRYGMLLLALSATFFFEGYAKAKNRPTSR
jgi:hypothetical protein